MNYKFLNFFQIFWGKIFTNFQNKILFGQNNNMPLKNLKNFPKKEFLGNNQINKVVKIWKFIINFKNSLWLSICQEVLSI